jgi:hypothetical protein
MSLGSGGILIMSITQYPEVSQGIKSIQRGLTASSGSVTISSVDTSKSFVTSFSTGAAGTVAINSSESGTLTPSGGSCASQGNGSNSGGSWPTYSGSRTLSGGTTSLISAEYGVSITNSTTLSATGACRWQVIEYN